MRNWILSIKTGSVKKYWELQDNSFFGTIWLSLGVSRISFFPVLQDRTDRTSYFWSCRTIQDVRSGRTIQDVLYCPAGPDCRTGPNCLKFADFSWNSECFSLGVIKNKNTNLQRYSLYSIFMNLTILRFVMEHSLLVLLWNKCMTFPYKQQNKK